MRKILFHCFLCFLSKTFKNSLNEHDAQKWKYRPIWNIRFLFFCWHLAIFSQHGIQTLWPTFCLVKISKHFARRLLLSSCSHLPWVKNFVSNLKSPKSYVKISLNNLKLVYKGLHGRETQMGTRAMAGVRKYKLEVSNTNWGSGAGARGQW